MNIGVVVCWCGRNIAGVVEIARVVSESSRLPGVVWAADYQYVCSDPGQDLIKQAITDHALDAVVIAACSPNMHETTFRLAASAAGLNPFRLEIANIREQVSWVHSDQNEATNKAVDLIASVVEKARRNEPLEPIAIPVNRRALVIGGGIAGMQAALEIADAGHEVVLVEREPNIGGRMAQLSETFPTLDCSSCILTPKTAEVNRHPRIRLITAAEVVEVGGYVGNFQVKIKKNPTYVDWDACTGCMECMQKCPKKTTSPFDRGLAQAKAIRVAFPQAVPYRPAIDRDACIKFDTGKCGVCAKVCPKGAIDFEQQESFEELEMGAIVVATGFDLLPVETFGEYGYGKYPDVIDGLQFERLNSASGPTTGEIRRPSDGKVPREIVFIQCSGSRDTERGVRYCSKICCMYTAKHAMLYKHKVHDGQAYVFYMDIRAGGKGYDEFVQRAIEEDKVLYLRGRVSRVYPEGDRLVVMGTDTLSGQNIEIRADMVVLATAIVPRTDAKNLAQALRVGTDEYGFFSEAHPKLKPVESLSRGVYLCGAAQAPKDIPETVSQAGSAASKVLGLFSAECLQHPPTVAAVDPEMCRSCGQCVSACPYGAREIDEARRVAVVREALCQGCGACAVACPNGATTHRNLSREQIMAMIDTLI